jgi:glycosyltransferase involved in cell wall biosynthesis
MCIFVTELSKKMKIVYIYTSFTIAGGADRVVIEKANYLAEHNYEVTIVTDSQQERSTFFPISPKVKLHDLAIDFEQEYKFNPLIRIFIYFNLMKKYERVLKKYLNKEKPDIVITTLGRNMDFLADIKDGSIKIGESHIAKPYIRNFHLLERKGPIHRLIAKIWMKKITKNCEKLDALVLLTKDDSKNWEGVTKTHIIPNPLPFAPISTSTCKNKQAIFVARMSEQKGYEFLINAWEIVFAKHPDWILNIYGDGEEKETIQRLIYQKGLNSVINLKGTTTNIQEKYLESSICILSSRFEGFGMVLLEAMTCGVPCVAFNCPYGPADIIKDGEDGFLVEHLNSTALAKRICDLIEDEALRQKMSTAAKRNIQRYNKENVMKEWINLFNSLISKRGKKIMYVFSELTIKGGTDKVITDKANYLSTQGYDVTIVTEAQMGKSPVFPLSPSVKLIDIGLNFNKQYTQSFFHRAYTYLHYIHLYKKRLKDIFERERPDIVITTMGRSLDFITNLKDGSIKIGEAHTTKYHLRSLHLMEERGGFYKWIARQIRRKQIANAKKLSALILLTPEDAKDWEGITKTYVIPNSIPSIPKECSKLDKKKAIFVGRYNDAKGYDYLVEAWDIVHQKHPDWIIDIYGSGELHDDVEQWIREAQLQDCMIMHEPTSHIMEKYLESSICVVSSRYEGFSMAIVEAMSCGVPCVSFDCPFGPRNIIKDGEDGILVEYLNSQKLADNICKLIENDHLRRQLGRKAKENIHRFSQDEIMRKWIELFNFLPANHGTNK